MKKRHQVLLVLAILSLITFLDRIAIGTLSKPIMAELNLSTQQWGWILGIFTLSYGGFEIPTGMMGDKQGAKKILIRVVIWWSFFTVVTGLATGFWMLLVIRFLFGMGEAGAYPNISIVLAKWFPAAERGRSQAIIWTASRLGAGLAPLIISPIRDSQFGWRGAFYFLGILGIIWVIFWKYWHKEEPSEVKDIKPSELEEILSQRELPKEHGASFFKKFKTSTNLWLLMTMYFCYASGAYFFQGWLTNYLEKGRGIKGDELKIFTSLPFLFAALGCFMGGFLSDFFVKKYGKKIGRRIIPVFSLAISGILVLLAASSENNTICMILLTASMALMDMTAPVSWAVSMDIGGKDSGSVSGAMNTAGLAGAYITTVSFGYLASNFGYNFPVALMGGILILGSLVWFKINAEVKLGESGSLL
jgi:MFS transporter, ACS family, glucarate transporter